MVFLVEAVPEEIGDLADSLENTPEETENEDDYVVDKEEEDPERGPDHARDFLEDAGALDSAAMNDFVCKAEFAHGEHD